MVSIFHAPPAFTFTRMLVYRTLLDTNRFKICWLVKPSAQVSILIPCVEPVERYAVLPYLLLIACTEQTPYGEDWSNIPNDLDLCLSCVAKCGSLEVIVLVTILTLFLNKWLWVDKKCVFSLSSTNPSYLRLQNLHSSRKELHRYV